MRCNRVRCDVRMVDMHTRVFVDLVVVAAREGLVAEEVDLCETIGFQELQADCM